VIKLGSIGSGKGPVACEHGDEPSSSGATKLGGWLVTPSSFQK
jgi:hypothetical protein